MKQTLINANFRRKKSFISLCFKGSKYECRKICFTWFCIVTCATYFYDQIFVFFSVWLKHHDTTHGWLTQMLRKNIRNSFASINTIYYLGVRTGVGDVELRACTSQSFVEWKYEHRQWRSGRRVAYIRNASTNSGSISSIILHIFVHN